MRQANAKHRRLQFVETAVAPTVHVDAILFPPAVLPQRAHAVRQLGVVRRDGTRVAQSAEVLGRIEAEATDVAQAARVCAIAARTVRLGAVFDDGDAAYRCYAADLIDRGETPIEVRGDDCARCRGKQGVEARRRQRQRVVVDVDVPRPRADCANGDGAVHACIGYGRHVVIGLHTDGAQCELESAGPIGETDTIPDTAN